MSSELPTLHPIEKAILKVLASEQSSVKIEQISEHTKLDLDQIRRGVEWLKFKNLISVDEKTESIIHLAEVKKFPKEQLQSFTKKLPERILVEAVRQGANSINSILEQGYFKDNREIGVAISKAKNNQWIGPNVKAHIILTDRANEKSEEEIVLDELVKNRGTMQLRLLPESAIKGVRDLQNRPDYIVVEDHKQSFISITEAGIALLPTLENEKSQERRLTSDLITSGKWKDVELSALDVEAPAPAVYPGRRHPLVDIIEEVKEIFVGLGFSEIDGPMVQSGFWNFDALFTPQDHPAREMQDTFYVSGRRQPIPASKDQIAKVSSVHKKGWGGWNAAEAERVVLRTHTTPVTLQHLARMQPDNARFFSVDRVFRNEKVSYKHLVEFHQVEGVATAPKASLRDLMGLQKEFYAKMGIKKIKFWPTFFPYTEPSLQSMVYNEKLEKWVELFGMGIFRPEVTRPLGIKNPVLAWGGGLERIAMLRFGLDDVRELYGNRLAWLRSVPRCQS